MLLVEMTSPEVEALPRDMVVVAPIASCEQHSLHLPVFTDSFIGAEVARRVHERIPDDVQQWLGFSQHHARYPGTVTAVSETHLLLMMDIVASMVANGFHKILLLNSHGGNRAGIDVLLQRLLERYQDEEAELGAADQKTEAVREIDRALARRGDEKGSRLDADIEDRFGVERFAVCLDRPRSSAINPNSPPPQAQQVGRPLDASDEEPAAVPKESDGAACPEHAQIEFTIVW